LLERTNRFEYQIHLKQLKDKTILVNAAGSGSEIARQVILKRIIVDQAETLLHHLFLEMNAMESKTKMEVRSS
jgi:TRAP-type uncharacterized transport system substrate-binding protein